MLEMRGSPTSLYLESSGDLVKDVRGDPDKKAWECASVPAPSSRVHSLGPGGPAVLTPAVISACFC